MKNLLIVGFELFFEGPLIMVKIKVRKKYTNSAGRLGC